MGMPRRGAGCQRRRAERGMVQQPSRRRMTWCSIAAMRPTAPGRINACARPTASSFWRAPTSPCRLRPLDLPAFKERACGLPELLLLHPAGRQRRLAGAFFAAQRPVRIPSPYPRRQQGRCGAAGALHRRPRRGAGAGGRRRAGLRPYRHHQGAEGSGRALRSSGRHLDGRDHRRGPGAGMGRARN